MDSHSGGAQVPLSRSTNRLNVNWLLGAASDAEAQSANHTLMMQARTWNFRLGVKATPFPLFGC